MTKEKENIIRELFKSTAEGQEYAGKWVKVLSDLKEEILQEIKDMIKNGD